MAQSATAQAVHRMLAQQRQQANQRLIEMAALVYEIPRQQYDASFRALLASCTSIKRLKTNGQVAILSVIMPSGERRKIVAKNSDCAGRNPKFDALHELAKEWASAVGGHS